MRIHPATAVLCFLAATVVACDNSRSTVIPADLSKFGEIQPALDKLDSADRRRVAAYEMRAHMGALFGNSPPTASVTIGQAIDDQTKFEAAAAAQEAEAKQLAAKAAAERAAKLQAMEQVLTVALTKLNLESGEFDKHIAMRLAFQNRSQKPIAGVKGVAISQDMFGDTITVSRVSYDEGIPASGLREWNGSKHFNQFMDDDRKLASTPLEKIKFRFEPSVIVFEDGSKLEAPEPDGG